MTPKRKQQMLEYTRKLRGGLKRPAGRIRTKEQIREEKNAKDRAKRAAEKEAGLRIDKRLKQNITKPHYKTLQGKDKPKPAPKRKASKVKLMGKVVKEIEKLPTRQIDLSSLIPLKLDHKTTIYIRPDQDPEAVRNKYLSRRG